MNYQKKDLTPHHNGMARTFEVTREPGVAPAPDGSAWRLGLRPDEERVLEGVVERFL